MSIANGLREVVEHALRVAPSLDSSDIDVATHGGVVTLTGHVPSYAERLEAEAVVKGLREVKALANDLLVQLPNSSARTDTDIAEAAVNALIWRSTVPQERIMVTVRGGWVTLEGELDWQYQRRAAEDAVIALTGVRGVSNRRGHPLGHPRGRGHPHRQSLGPRHQT